MAGKSSTSTGGCCVPRMPLLVRGLLWRRTLVLAVLAVAVVTMAVAALGPLYARAADESTLRDTLTQAPVDQSGPDLASFATRPVGYATTATRSSPAWASHDRGTRQKTRLHRAVPPRLCPC